MTQDEEGKKTRFKVAKFIMEQLPDGTWAIWHDGQLVASAPDNRRAWLVVDRLRNEAVSRQEQLSDWIAAKNDQ